MKPINQYHMACKRIRKLCANLDALFYEAQSEAEMRKIESLLDTAHELQKQILLLRKTEGSNAYKANMGIE